MAQTLEQKPKKAHLFMMKTLNKLRIEKNFLHLIKYMYEKPTAIITPNDKRWDAFPLNLGKRQSCLPSPLLFNIVVEF